MKIPALTPNTKTAAVLLRVGLAITFLYAGIAALRDPLAWAPFLPSFLIQHLPSDIVLKLFSLFQFMLAVWLVSGWRVRYAAILCALTFVGIIVTNPNTFDITFRDVALTCMALALLFLER